MKRLDERGNVIFPACFVLAMTVVLLCLMLWMSSQITMMNVRNEIKNEMNARETEELAIGSHIVRFTSVLTSRFDTKRFKEAFGEDIYKAFTKEVSSRRFSIA